MGIMDLKVKGVQESSLTFSSRRKGGGEEEEGGKGKGGREGVIVVFFFCVAVVPNSGSLLQAFFDRSVGKVYNGGGYPVMEVIDTHSPSHPPTPIPLEGGVFL